MVALHPPPPQSVETSTATTTYVRCASSIFLLYPPEKIRNEKVGCSIHLSGTKSAKKPRYQNGSGVFLFHVMGGRMPSAVMVGPPRVQLRSVQAPCSTRTDWRYRTISSPSGSATPHLWLLWLHCHLAGCERCGAHILQLPGHAHHSLSSSPRKHGHPGEQSAGHGYDT